MKLKKKQKEALLTWISEGLKSDEINERASQFKPRFDVSKQQVEYYRKTRNKNIEEIVASGEHQALTTGLALKANRVHLLQRLAERFIADLFDKDLVWTDQVKGIGGAENFVRIDYEEFNTGEVQQLRGVLDDIAREVGERRQNEEPIPVIAFSLDEWKKAREERLKAVKKLPAE